LWEWYIWHVNCSYRGMVKGKDNGSSFKGLKWGGWGDSLVILAPFETHRA